MVEALFSLSIVTLPLEQIPIKDVLTVRVVKYTSKLTEQQRVVLEKEVSVYCPDIDRKMKSPEQIARFAKLYLKMQELPEEYMYMLCFNTKLDMIGVFEISHGNVNSSVVGTREVFQKALLANAVCIAMIHNHPSGDPTPSREDIEVTKRLEKAGDILGIQVLDHIIIGRPTYTSLKEKGYL